jgi:hypothetical protein
VDRVSGLDLTIRPVQFSGTTSAGYNVLVIQVGEVTQQLRLGHSCRQIAQHVVNRYPGFAQTGLAATTARFDPKFRSSNQPQISQMAQIKKDRIECIEPKLSPAG